MISISPAFHRCPRRWSAADCGADASCGPSFHQVRRSENGQSRNPSCHDPPYEPCEVRNRESSKYVGFQADILRLNGGLHPVKNNQASARLRETRESLPFCLISKSATAISGRARAEQPMRVSLGVAPQLSSQKGKTWRK